MLRPQSAGILDAGPRFIQPKPECPDDAQNGRELGVAGRVPDNVGVQRNGLRGSLEEIHTGREFELICRGKLDTQYASFKRLA